MYWSAKKGCGAYKHGLFYRKNMTKVNGWATLARPVRQELIFSTNVGICISLTNENKT